MQGNRHKLQILPAIRKNVPQNEDDQMLQWDPEEWEKYSSLETSKNSTGQGPEQPDLTSKPALR